MADSKKENSEQKAVEYLKKQIDYSQPKAVLAIYTQLIEQDIFQTRVGLSFLTGLHKYLVDHGMIEDESAKKAEPIETESDKTVSVKKAVPKEQEKPAKEPEPKKQKSSRKSPSKKDKQTESQNNPYRTRFLYSLFINIVLVAVIIAMFVITLTSDNPNIINYKHKIEDEYASWEQDLDNREKALNSWERDLNDRQNEQDDE